MNIVCEAAAPFIANSAVEGKPVARPFRAHADGCLKCQARHVAMTRTARELASMASETYTAPHDLEWRVMSALEGELAVARSWRTRSQKRGTWHPYPVPMAALAAKQVYEKSGLGPEDVDVVELHDCFTANELLTYEALSLCKEGEAEKFIWDGDNTYGGKFVTNPSGGLLSKGHPLGATGIANIYEVSTHLRGEAGKRQVPNARLGMTHVIGLGSACGVQPLSNASTDSPASAAGMASASSAAGISAGDTGARLPGKIRIPP